jgi:hypothetical protein
MNSELPVGLELAGATVGTDSMWNSEGRHPRVHPPLCLTGPCRVGVLRAAMTSEDLARRAGIVVFQPTHDGRGKRKPPGGESPRPATRAAEAHP